LVTQRSIFRGNEALEVHRVGGYIGTDASFSEGGRPGTTPGHTREVDSEFTSGKLILANVHSEILSREARQTNPGKGIFLSFSGKEFCCTNASY